jgi:hypothetical protein
VFLRVFWKIFIALKIKDITNFVLQDITNFVLQDIFKQGLISMCSKVFAKQKPTAGTPIRGFCCTSLKGEAYGLSHILTKTTLQPFYKEPIIEVVDKNPLILCFTRH